MDDSSIASGTPRGVEGRDAAGGVDDLERALQWQQAIFQGSRDAIFISDEDSRFIAVNRAACDLTGYPHEELLKLYIPDLHEDVDLDAYRRYHEAIMAGQDNLTEAMLRRKDGTKVPTEFSNRCIVVDGKHYMHTTARDLSQRQRAEAALREANLAFEAVVMASPLAIIVIDSDAKVTRWNPAAERLFGWSAAEIVGKPTPIVPPGEEPSFAALRQKHAEGVTQQGRELVRRRKDGSLVDVALWTAPLRDTVGHVVATVGLFADIGERKRGERELKNQLGLLQGLADAMPFPVFVKDATGRFIRTNAAFDAFFGSAREAVIGKSVFEVTSRELAETFAASDRGLLREGGAHTYEGPFLGADGATRKVIIRKAAYHEPDGTIGGVVGVIVDLTERERVEGLQRAIYEISEASYQARALNDLFVAIHSIVGRYMEAKNLYIALYDPASNLLSFPYFVDEVDATPEPLQLRKNLTSYVIRTGTPLLATPEVFEELVRRGDVESEGASSIDWLGVPLIARDRVIGALVVQTYTEGVRYGEPEKEILTFVSHQVAQAIERKRAEDALRESEERFAGAFEHASTGVAIVEPDGRWRRVNRALCELVGYSEEELLGLRFQDITHPDDLEADANLIRRMLAGETRTHRMEKRYIHKSGHVVWVLVNVSIVRNDQGEPLYFISQIQGITDRKQAEQALRESEERYRMLFQRAPAGVFQYDQNLRITECNDRFVDIIQGTREGIIGLDMNLLKDRRVLPAIRAAVQGEHGEYEGPYEAMTGAGRPFVSMWTAPLHSQDGTVVGGIAIVQDVTEHQKAEKAQRHLEAQLLQAQKMQAIGSLAGGVAHDFNNLLQAMLGQVELVRSAPADAARVAHSIAELEQQVRRGAALARQLLLFSRREASKSEALDLNEVIEGMRDLLGRLVRDDITLVIQLAQDPLPVFADRGKLDQVLMNLVVNASDAMPDGGQLTVRTGAGEGDRAWLAVEDTGTGIPPENRERIFEPFFTTKGDQGSGLGLSVVHGIVTQHGGAIEVAEREGGGTVFRIGLPKAQAGPARPTAEPRVGGDEMPVGAGERILVVEDEDAARAALADLLTMLGYQVAAVASSEDAGRLPVEPPFDLLLTDFLLPGASGTDLARGLQARWRRLKVILMSGYAEDETVRRGVGGGWLRFLQKPFDMKTLAQEVAAVLHEQPQPSIFPSS
jgi:two-component system cell cycle sensor histidine kinase/response regulator CckA